MTSQSTRWLLRASAILWAIWGLVHILAGVMTLVTLQAGETAKAIHAIAQRGSLENLQLAYPEALVAILSQHGFNLAWFGLVTLAASPFVWRGRKDAIYLAALVGGLADTGYFVFIDLGGYALPPGPQMTWICAAAIITGLVGLRGAKLHAAS